MYNLTKCVAQVALQARAVTNILLTALSKIYGVVVYTINFIFSTILDGLLHLLASIRE